MKINKESAMRVVKLANIVGESGFDFSAMHFMALIPSGDGLEVHFVNSTITAKMQMPMAEGPATGVCLPKKEVLRFMEACNGDDIDIQVDGELARLKHGKSRMTAKTIVLEGFPFPTPIDAAFSVPVQARHLQAALSLCCGLVSVSVESANLDVHLALDQGLRAYTTDGKNLAHAEIPLDDTVSAALAGAQTDICLSVKTANTLIKMLDMLEEESQVELLISDRGLILEDPMHQWSFQCALKCDAKAVPWRRIDEQQTQEICRAPNIEAIQDSMEVCMSVADDKHVAVMIAIKADSFSFELENEKGSSSGSTTDIEVLHQHMGYVPFLPIKALFAFCRKFSSTGQLHISEIGLPHAKPLKWEWHTEEGLKHVFMVTAAYMNK